MPYTITREDAERDLRALRGALSGFPVSISSSSVPALQELADAIEQQVKPAVGEPQQFASVVKARDIIMTTYPTGMFWTRVSGGIWIDDVAGTEREWDKLDVVEVLRVGLGDPSSEPTGEFEAGYWACQADAHGKLQKQLAEAITGERKNAYERAIQAVEELAP